MKAKRKPGRGRYAQYVRATLLRYGTLARHWLKRRTGNLVWAPYLQQLGANQVVVLWATRQAGIPVVHHYRAGFDKAGAKTTQGNSRRIAALGIQLHRVELTGLQPDTPFKYAVEIKPIKGARPDSVVSTAVVQHSDSPLGSPQQWFSFHTAPPTGSDTPFTFLAFGDYGNGTASQLKLRDQMARELRQGSSSTQRARFILTVGDNSQGSGTYRQLDMRVFSIYGEVFSRAAVFPALGNHDYLTQEAAPCLDLFDLPQSANAGQEAGRYYSFDYGNTHVTVLDTNRPLEDAIQRSDGSGMLAWLKDDLQTTQRWKVVVCHHPPYNTGDRGCDMRVREHIVPLLEAHGVHLVLSGHQHNYQRSKPLRGGKVTTVQGGGIVYVVTGAGARAKHACQDGAWLDSAICSASHGLYNRITVGSNSLHIEAIDDLGRIRDRYILQKDSMI